MRRWMSLMLTFSFALAVLSGCGEKETQEKTLTDILTQVEMSEDGTEFAYALLPWGSSREEAMTAQGYGEEDLEDLSAYPDSESETVTKRLPAAGLDAEVRMINNWYGDGQLGAFAYYIFFETQDAAEAFFADLLAEYEDAFPGEVAVMQDGGRTTEFQIAVPKEVSLTGPVSASSTVWAINAQESAAVYVPYIGQQEAGEYVVFVEAVRDPEKAR